MIIFAHIKLLNYEKNILTLFFSSTICKFCRSTIIKVVYSNALTHFYDTF